MSLIFLGLDNHACYGLDPNQMITNILDASDILGRDDERLTFPVVRDRTPKLNHTVTHHNVDLRRPWLLGQFILNLTADGFVILGRRLRLACEARKRMKQIGAAYDSDHFI